MKAFGWSPEKSGRLRQERGLGFEEIVFHIENGDLLDVIAHPQPERSGRQQIFVVAVEGYAYLVPFIEDDEKTFLKTIIPSRKATRDYLLRKGGAQ